MKPVPLRRMSCRRRRPRPGFVPQTLAVFRPRPAARIRRVASGGPTVCAAGESDGDLPGSRVAADVAPFAGKACPCGFAQCATTLEAAVRQACSEIPSAPRVACQARRSTFHGLNRQSASRTCAMGSKAPPAKARADIHRLIRVPPLSFGTSRRTSRHANGFPASMPPPSFQDNHCPRPVCRVPDLCQTGRCSVGHRHDWNE